MGWPFLPYFNHFVVNHLQCRPHLEGRWSAIFLSISISRAGYMAGAVCDPADRGSPADFNLPAKRSDERYASYDDGHAV